MIRRMRGIRRTRRRVFDGSGSVVEVEGRVEELKTTHLTGVQGRHGGEGGGGERRRAVRAGDAEGRGLELDEDADEGGGGAGDPSLHVGVVGVVADLAVGGDGGVHVGEGAEEAERGLVGGGEVLTSLTEVLEEGVAGDLGGGGGAAAPSAAVGDADDEAVAEDLGTEAVGQGVSRVQNLLAGVGLADGIRGDGLAVEDVGQLAGLVHAREVLVAGGEDDGGV